MNIGELTQWVIDETVSALASSEATDKGLSPCPTKRRVHFGNIGEVAWDQCCAAKSGGNEPGQLIVAVGRMFPSSTNFPQPDSGEHRPSHPSSWAVPITVELVRCTPTVDGSGQIDWDAAENDTELRLAESFEIACWFEAVLGRGVDVPDGFLTSQESVTQSNCRAVRIGMTLHLL